jgi:outer membrane protein assembly factor BamA
MGLLRTGMALSLGRQLWKDTAGQLRLNFEKNTIQNLWADENPDTTVSKPPIDTDPNLATPNHPLEFWDNSAELNLTKNQLIYQDSNFVSGGYELSADYTVAGKYLGGAYDYSKTLLDGRWFHSLGSNFVFGTRLQGSLINGDYPDYDALYLGGMYKLRGYDDRRYNGSETMPLIGTEYLLSNTELRYRIPGNKNAEMAIFYDIGTMGKDAVQTTKSDYGIGFRFNIPMLGLIRLDQAWNSDGSSRMVFSLGEMF